VHFLPLQRRSATAVVRWFWPGFGPKFMFHVTCPRETATTVQALPCTLSRGRARIARIAPDVRSFHPGQEPWPQGRTPRPPGASPCLWPCSCAAHSAVAVSGVSTSLRVSTHASLRHGDLPAQGRGLSEAVGKRRGEPDGDYEEGRPMHHAPPTRVCKGWDRGKNSFLKMYIKRIHVSAKTDGSIKARRDPAHHGAGT